MSKKQKSNFRTAAGIIFLLVAVTHLTIVVTGSTIAINGEVLGSWVSWLAFITTGYMGLVAFEVA
ncbi:MAG: hypothetical protein ACI9GH_000638 [Candidatus Paceibacteria bacterium]|jgi:hypothetical protein